MPACFRIFPEHGVVVFRYWGDARLSDYEDMIRTFPENPDFSLALKHLVDLGALERFERNPLKLMLLQARIAEHTARAPSEILSVMLAPTEIGRKAARLVKASWDRLDSGVVRRVVSRIDEAALLLGIDEADVRAMLAQTRLGATGGEQRG